MKHYWYHCSEEDLGKSFTSSLRLPTCCSVKEPPVPRLCVAKTVAQCFAARLFVKPVFVYKTATQCNAVRPRNVWDLIVTDERWIIHKQLMVLDRIIPLDVVDNITLPVRWYHHRTKKHSTLAIRVCTLALAVKHLGGNQRRVNKMLKCLKITDPEEYFFDQISRCAK